eukprot:12027850-Prorocentrum_lima.AAC.1
MPPGEAVLPLRTCWRRPPEADKLRKCATCGKVAYCGRACQRGVGDGRGWYAERRSSAAAAK